MSILPDSARRPAEFGWPGGDHPGAVRFESPVDPAARDAILAALPGEWSAATLTALTAPEGVIGRYRAALGGETRFVRVSARWGDSRLEQAITGWLQTHGVAVNHLETAGLRVTFAGEDYRLDVRPFVEGRHFDGSEADLRAVAAALADCHRHLRAFPEAAAVREHSIRRSERLETARQNIAAALARRDWRYFSDDTAWAETHAGWLDEMARRFDPFFDRLPGAQCLHAQVHRANVVFRAADAQPVLVDFEEAVQTFAPVAWDLAYFVQRFCLHDEPGDATAAQRLRIVREAYGAWPGGVVEMMRQSAWLSMAIIVSNRAERGIVNPPGEYAKFVTLERQAGRFAALLEDAAC